MPIQISCPSCNRLLAVPDTLIGQRVKCPTCSATFTAAEGGSGPSPSSPPTQAYPPPPPPERASQFAESRAPEGPDEGRRFERLEEDTERRPRRRDDDFEPERLPPTAAA